MPKSLFVKKQTPRELHPPGTVVCTVYGIEPTGLQPGFTKDTAKPAPPVQKYVILMESAERITSGPLTGKRHHISVIVSGSLNIKSTLYRLAVALGCDVSGEGFDLTTMIGRSCLVSIRHERNGDKTVLKYDAFAPLPKGVCGFVAESSPDDVPGWVRDMQAKALDANAPAPARPEDPGTEPLFADEE